MGATHAERLPVLLSTRDDRDERTLEAFEDERPRILHGEGQCRVEHVGRREPVVEPATLLAESGRDRIDERGNVVVRLALDLGDALGARDDRPAPDLVDRIVRHEPDLGPPLERRELDVEPSVQLLLLRPDQAHGRAGVASNHERHSRAWPGAAPADPWLEAAATPEEACSGSGVAEGYTLPATLAASAMSSRRRTPSQEIRSAAA